MRAGRGPRAVPAIADGQAAQTWIQVSRKTRKKLSNTGFKWHFGRKGVASKCSSDRRAFWIRRMIIGTPSFGR